MIPRTCRSRHLARHPDLPGQRHAGGERDHPGEHRRLSGDPGRSRHLGQARQHRQLHPGRRAGAGAARHRRRQQHVRAPARAAVHVHLAAGGVAGTYAALTQPAGLAAVPRRCARRADRDHAGGDARVLCQPRCGGAAGERQPGRGGGGARCCPPGRRRADGGCASEPRRAALRADGRHRWARRWRSCRRPSTAMR